MGGWEGSQIEIKPETQRRRLKNSSAFLLAASGTMQRCQDDLQMNIHTSE